MNHIHRVQKYLDGEMSEEEIRLFEEDVQIDPLLAEELELHRQIIKTVSEHDEVRFRKKLKEAYATYSKGKVRFPSFRLLKKPFHWIYLVGVLMVGILLIYNSLGKQYISTDDLFDLYYTKYSQEVQSRSSSDESSDNLIVGIYYFYTGDYMESVKRLSEFLENDSSATANFYLGLNQIELGNYGLAIEEFKKVLNMDFNYYQEHCRWYMSLCYLKLNKNEIAKENLQNFTQKKSFYTVKATEIINLL